MSSSLWKKRIICDAINSTYLLKLVAICRFYQKNERECCLSFSTWAMLPYGIGALIRSFSTVTKVRSPADEIYSKPKKSRRIVFPERIKGYMPLLNETKLLDPFRFSDSSYIFPDYYRVHRNTIKKQLERILKNHVVMEVVGNGEKRRIMEAWKKPFNSFRATRVTELIEEIGIFDLRNIDRRPPSKKTILRDLSYQTIDPTHNKGDKNNSD